MVSGSDRAGNGASRRHTSSRWGRLQPSAQRSRRIAHSLRKEGEREGKKSTLLARGKFFSMMYTQPSGEEREETQVCDGAFQKKSFSMTNTKSQWEKDGDTGIR